MHVILSHVVGNFISFSASTALTSGVTSASGQFVTFWVSTGARAGVTCWHLMAGHVSTSALVTAAGQVTSGCIAAGTRKRIWRSEGVNLVHDIGGGVILTLRWRSTVIYIPVRGSPIQLRVFRRTYFVDIQMWGFILIWQVVRYTGTGNRFVWIDPHSVTLEIVDRASARRFIWWFANRY